jgi:hypothetical protein
MYYWHHWYKIRIYRFGFAGLNINKTTYVLFTKQLLLVFNVGKPKTACCILTFICTISNSIEPFLKVYVLVRNVSRM